MSARSNLQPTSVHGCLLLLHVRAETARKKANVLLTPAPRKERTRDRETQEPCRILQPRQSSIKLPGKHPSPFRHAVHRHALFSSRLNPTQRTVPRNLKCYPSKRYLPARPEEPAGQVLRAQGPSAHIPRPSPTSTRRRATRRALVLQPRACKYCYRSNCKLPLLPLQRLAEYGIGRPLCILTWRRTCFSTRRCISRFFLDRGWWKSCESRKRLVCQICHSRIGQA